MGDVVVENPANVAQPHKKNAPSTIPSIENFEGVSTEGGDEYATLKRLQRQLEYIQLQEEYIKDEQRYYHRGPNSQVDIIRVNIFIQEPKARTRTGSRGDQEDSERSPSHRPVYGGH